MKHDPHETSRRLGRYAKNDAVEDFLLSLNRSLKGIELPPVHHAIDPSEIPIIYIVGAPRSGTTLLSQLVSRYLTVGYMNNLVARFWLRPSVGIVLSRALLGLDGRRMITFESSYGTTQGVSNPHEFGYFWRHWLRMDLAETHHLSEAELGMVDAVGLKSTIEREILQVFGIPVVFKNVLCGFHASFLASLHPNSLFVYVERDDVAVIKSFLKARMERYGSFHSWWSIRPSGYPYTSRNLDPVSEVTIQVTQCKKEMQEELSKAGVHALTVEYETICRDPLAVLNTICRHPVAEGIPFENSLSDLPMFLPSPGPDLPDEMEDHIHRLVIGGRSLVG